ncbi:Retrovirus-related Pol polyprotein from transposon TNT 1-94 [Apostasia shenzhenica]|uniref:Retrovirus-related Pol polyprotein from transposon TNT 1-94 n=1 Tax=Apostasia shenzhenica TaxID=1088818 RepID=A0A2H9ZQX5_9ASPA|nr:Retrovirus-related Pol polyprotein from transposon TNT 1-94 [Apostasia shenzhenica]
MHNVPYANVIGCLMYAMICTRPDLSHAVSVVSRYKTNPKKEHWYALKWILRYLKDTSDCGLLFKKNLDSDLLVGYVDFDYADDLDKRRSTTGFIFTLGGGPISWKATL